MFYRLLTMNKVVYRI